MILLIKIFGIGLVLFYFLFIRWTNGWWNKAPIIDIPLDYIPKTKISIIIPVRNEALHIKRLIDSIVDNHYPPELIEIIFINDSSTDNTVEIIESMDLSMIKVIHLQTLLQSDKINAYKKAALNYGINHSMGELIITTDGDGHVSKEWLARYAYCYENNDVKFMAAPLLFKGSGKFIESFQQIDMISMMGITCAGISSNKFFMANGANLAFEKEVYLELNPFNNDDPASGDDMFLVQSIAKHYPNKLMFIKDPTSVVWSKTEDNYPSFWKQRKRWAGKSAQYEDMNIKVLLASIFLVNTIPYIICLLGFYSVELFYLGLLLLGFKYIIDRIYLRKIALFYKEYFKEWTIFKSSLFYLVYILFTGFYGLFPSSYDWKNRKVD